MTTKTKKSTKKPEPPSRRTPILLITFGAIAALLIAAIVFSSDDPIGSAGEYGEPTISGAALPLMPASGEDAAIGMPIPEVTGQDFNGNQVEIKRDGTPKAILFVWHHCGHCQNEIPEVQAWLNSGGGVDGVDIITVSTAATSGRDNWPPSEWLEREGWTSPVIADNAESSTFLAFGGQGVPYWVFVDGDGNVLWRNGGRLPIETIEAAMLATLG